MEKKRYTKPQTIPREELERALFQANEELSQANEKLNRQEKERMELFRNLSHDLRAPMTALVSTIGLLREKKDMPETEYQELLDMMGRRLKNLSAMLDEIFLLGQMENPQLELKLEEIDAAALLEEFYYSCEADGKYAKRSLSLSLPEDLQCMIMVDAQKLVRVLDNLFTNALRYSKDGDEIALSAQLIGEKLQICVSDTGVGITPEDLPHVFERSYRADRSRTPGDGGHGLGLAIAKSIMDKHGGRIWVESVTEHGSSFFLELPALLEK
ncbi:MAG: HAMP domain-containing histidine kinase [Lachnospiraceae bacterium]|nr:HAMP domain-containing histidine kinase [Lachnospiraceae bacterium]MBQ2101811.1 HAMP domain-containing histidine kinase [Lachnospiraceae bacterium]